MIPSSQTRALQFGWREVVAMTLRGLVAFSTFTGCAPKAAEETPRPPVTVKTVRDLQEALRAAGREASLGEPILPGPQGTSAWVLRVGEEELNVFELDAGATGDEIVQGLLASEQLGEGLRIWVTEQLVVTYRGDEGGTVLLLSALLGDPLSPTSPSAEGPYPPAVLAAIAEVARRTDVNPQRVRVISFQEKVWSDECLGLGRPGEQCRAAEIEGWQISLEAAGKGYEVRSDQVGGTIRVR